MPIFRHSNKVICFSHIPKCGGSSVEDYLQSLAVVSVAFLDRSFDVHSSSREHSPQHIYGKDLNRLFPAEFFDEFFTIVRNPISRFRSAFYFNQITQKTIDHNMEINDFISNLSPEIINGYGYYDGHFAPQIMFLYPNVQYKVFRFEDGLSAVKMYIDNCLFGRSIEGKMPHTNATNFALGYNDISCESVDRLKLLYKKDYEILGY